jgi:acetolactate synthase I/III small subunit
MQEYQLAVVAGRGRLVPARVAGLLIPQDTEITSLEFRHPPNSDEWWIYLTVRVPTRQRLEFVAKRLALLIDVYRVVIVDRREDRRRPTRAQSQPDQAEVVDIDDIHRWFQLRSIEMAPQGPVSA